MTVNSQRLCAGDAELIPDYTQEWTPSELSQKLMAIAKEEGNEIGEDTLRIIDSITYREVVPRGATGTIKECLDLFKDSAALGKLLFDKVLPCLGPIGATAAIIKDLITIFDHKEDPVMKELKELEFQIKKLSEQMSNQFDDLKAFQVENNFYEKYTIDVNALFQYMADVTANPSELNLNEFKKAYEKMDPKMYVYKILSMMDLDETNPLKWAMRADSLQKKATFVKWRDIMDNTLTHLLVLEAFASGLFFGKDTTKQDQVTAKIAKFKTLVKQWDNEYKKSPDWWKKGKSALHDFVKDVCDNGSISGHEAKADKIFNEIKSIHTDDQFYVVVFGDHVWRNHYNDNRNVIEVEQNGYNAIVYRTPQCDPTEDWQMRELANCGDFIMGLDFRCWNILKAFFTHDQIVKYSNDFKNHKFFVGIAQCKSLIALRYTTHGRYGSSGPGSFTFDARIEHKIKVPFAVINCCTFEAFYLSCT